MARHDARCPVLGVLENRVISLVRRGKRIEVFGESKAEAIAREYGIPAVSRLPLDAEIAKLADAGRIEDYETDGLQEVYRAVEGA